METKDAVLLGIMVIVFCVPALAITARIILRPILEWRAASAPSLDAGAEQRMRQLEDEVRQLRGSVAELETTVDFQQKLLAGAPAQPSVLELVPAQA